MQFGLGIVKLICAGEAFEDLIFVGLDRLPELGEEVKTDRFTSTIGGGAVITAVKAARLGMKTTLISALSDAAIARLKKQRVAITNLRKRGEPHAITAALSTGHDRAFVTYNGVNAHARRSRLARVIPKATGTRTFICASTRTTVGNGRESCRGCAPGASPHRGTSAGMNPSRTTAASPASSTRSTSSSSTSTKPGCTPASRPLEAALPHWRRRQAITIIKIGEAGAVWVAPDRDIHVEAPKVKVVDTTGAGDSFNAGFLVAWMNGKSPEQCLKAGNRVGADSTA